MRKHTNGDSSRFCFFAKFGSPEAFLRKRVVVVGMSNTGCDISLELAPVAEKVYLSHRAGARIVSQSEDRADDQVKRCSGGRPMDHGLTRRLSYLMSSFGRVFPRLRGIVLDFALESRMKKMFPRLDPSWRLLPAPPDANANAVFNDHLIDNLASGAITSVSGVKRFTETGIETEFDGLIEIDSIIFATGYQFDYSPLGLGADPTSSTTLEWDESVHNNGLLYPRLYQTLFSPTYPLSLAFIGPCQGYTFAAFCHADLASQAIAQVWLGNFPLPDSRSIEKWCDSNYAYALSQIKRWRIPKTGTENGALEVWLNKAAGNGMEEKLGWGREGWTFWWKDREMYKLIMDGVNTPFVYRLFEGRAGARKRWDGAREAIYRANGIRLKM